LSLVVRVGVVSAAAVFAALSVVLLLSFAVSALGQPDGVERLFKVLVACAAGVAFFVVGRGIWRDLRERHPSPQPEARKKRRSAEDG
jgi:Kef-type K+ transport system membrane component KefB